MHVRTVCFVHDASFKPLLGVHEVKFHELIREVCVALLAQSCLCALRPVRHLTRLLATSKVLINDDTKSESTSVNTSRTQTSQVFDTSKLLITDNTKGKRIPVKRKQNTGIMDALG